MNQTISLNKDNNVTTTDETQKMKMKKKCGQLRLKNLHHKLKA